MNSSQVISLLQESPLFNRVKSSLLAAHLGNATRLKLAAGEILLTPGRENNHLYFVLSGRLRALLHLDDPVPVALFGLSECVGEMSMFDDNQVSAYVLAATDCELLVVDHTDVWSILNESLQASHNLLTILANRIRASNRMLAQSMEQKAGYQPLDFIDPVTGIYNHRWLADNIGRLIQRSIHSHQPSAFILLQIENFKQYHADYGSLGSDQAQRTIAQAMLHCLRPNDVATHFGGEQFAIFLPQTKLESVSVITERLLHNINAEIIVTPSGDALPSLNVSVGVCQVHPSDTLETLVARTQAVMGQPVVQAG